MCPAAATATTAPAVESYGDKNKPGGLGNIVGAPLLRPRKLGVTDEVNLSASGTKEPKSSGVIPVSFRESKKVTMSVPGPWYHYYVESVVYMISGVAVVWIMHKYESLFMVTLTVLLPQPVFSPGFFAPVLDGEVLPRSTDT